MAGASCSGTEAAMTAIGSEKFPSPYSFKALTLKLYVLPGTTLLVTINLLSPPVVGVTRIYYPDGPWSQYSS